MSLPTFIAIEAAAADAQSFPVSIAWSLPDGSIKHALIQPDDSWLEAGDERPVMQDADLTVESYSADEVVRELLYDQQDDVYYLDQLHPQEGWLLKLFAAAGQEVTFELAEAVQLCEAADWSQAYQETQQFLGLDPTRAEDQVRALLETHVMLTGEQPDETAI
ncbi:hypothetical protein [Marinospirillum alkaliphilum]|uniref:Uncharacterized protein n=1 Tax=Marinospirillum alkaliphilum DSM 21637 TaxID=1122209 RepID=A0A1K1TC81_9GAMM|nr:hypothetical protein [Marinospirillum alkaliphilum]SFW98239.1 hypothetical protein SAMN02745752_00061 [Marinospirillum alkaliphilum DSM 21637]